MHEDLNRIKVKPKLLFDERFEDSLSAVQRAELAWNRYHALNDSFIFDLFGGQLQSTIHCLACSYESVTFDTFWDLSLPIPKV
jgi:ubiquitin carboxyl-terminal hydrolase 2/21